MRLIQDVLSDDAVEQVRKAIGSERPTIVPVLAVEATGHNKIPAVAATALGQRLGLPVDAGIYQSVRPSARRSMAWAASSSSPNSTAPYSQARPISWWTTR